MPEQENEHKERKTPLVLELEDSGMREREPVLPGHVSDGTPQAPRMSHPVCYRHSGRIPLKTFIHMLAAGGLSVFILGWAYPLFLYWNNSVCLNVAACFAFAYAIGFVVAGAAKISEARNPWMVAVFAFFSGCAAVYWVNVNWIQLTTELDAPLNPTEFLNALQAIALEGQWHIFGWKPQGLVLKLVWFAEAVVLTALTALVAHARAKTEPDREACGAWLDAACVIQKLEPVANPAYIRKRLLQGDFRPLMWMKKTESTAKLFTRIEVKRCPHCRELHLLSVKRMRCGWDEKKRSRVYEDPLVEHLVITPEVSHWVRKHVGVD